MYYTEEMTMDVRGHKMALVKDRSQYSKPGKYLARPKAERPKDKLAEAKAERCQKMKIRSIDVAKSIISSARWSRAKAAAEGRVSKRREDRWYLCEVCGTGTKAKIWHVTRLTEKEYAEKFEASLEGGFSLAA
jgi:hypothetical protein